MGHSSFKFDFINPFPKGFAGVWGSFYKKLPHIFYFTLT